jgi:indoleamine 2,3-dioxygenase
MENPPYLSLMDVTNRSFNRGFLPPEDPLERLPQPFDPWEQTADILSKLALTTYIRPEIKDLPPFPVQDLKSLDEYERAMSLLSFMANLYVFAPDHQIVQMIPKILAVPWQKVGQALGRPPMLTYASQVMYNWKRICRDDPVKLGNLVMNQNFLGGMDEEWFVTVHINIEAATGKVLSKLISAQEAIKNGDVDQVTHTLSILSETLREMYQILLRMPERCNPDTYYHRVRPYMFGWKNNPDLSEGMIYEGVESFGGKPQHFRGESGAQSSIIYAFDGFLGIEHDFDEMRAYLMEMRLYMPIQDRHFIEVVERGPSLRKFLNNNNEKRLIKAYNESIEALYDFRKLHIEYAAMYIIKPAQKEKKGAVGTGGTPFTVYLKKHIDETLKHIIR